MLNAVLRLLKILCITGLSYIGMDIIFKIWTDLTPSWYRYAVPALIFLALLSNVRLEKKEKAAKAAKSEESVAVPVYPSAQKDDIKDILDRVKRARQ